MLRENPFEIYANLSCIGFIFSPLVIFLKFFTVDSQCENGPDIALILDVSGIVKDIDLWMVRYFVKAVTGQIFNLCPKLNTPIVSFGEEATVVKNISKIFSLPEFSKALDLLTPLQGDRTMTYKGLRVTSERVFPFSRKNVSKIAILITHGKNTPPYTPDEAARELIETGVRLLGVDVAFYARRHGELQRITERRGDVIYLEMFHYIFDYVDTMVSKIIAAVGKTIGVN